MLHDSHSFRCARSQSALPGPAPAHLTPRVLQASSGLNLTHSLGCASRHADLPHSFLLVQAPAPHSQLQLRCLVPPRACMSPPDAQGSPAAGANGLHHTYSCASGGQANADVPGLQPRSRRRTLSQRTQPSLSPQLQPRLAQLEQGRALRQQGVLLGRKLPGPAACNQCALPCSIGG